MTIQYQLFLGTDTNGRMPEGYELSPATPNALAAARQLAFDLAAHYFPGGHSIREEMGRWQHANGSCVTERTVVITWLSSAEQDLNGQGQKAVYNLAGEYKTRAYQEAVLVTEQEVEAILI